MGISVRLNSYLPLKKKHEHLMYKDTSGLSKYSKKINTLENLPCLAEE